MGRQDKTNSLITFRRYQKTQDTAWLLPFKDDNHEQNLFVHRVIWIIILLIIVLTWLIARLAYLQIMQHDHYSTQSRDNRVNILPLIPRRGLIYDRRGVLLADNKTIYSLELTPEQIPDLQRTVVYLKNIVEISREDEQRFYKQIHRKHPFESVPLRLQLSEDEVARLAIVRYRFPGVEIKARLARSYPQGAITSHVVGYVGRISEEDLKRIDAKEYQGSYYIGKTGIESKYESLLHGKLGVQQVEVNAKGRILRTLDKTPPVAGVNLYLAIDTQLQQIAEEVMQDYSGSVVAIEPGTGDILALVSHPGYDPNPFVSGIKSEDYQALQNAPTRPLYNRALRGQYPPGSTLKPFVALAGIAYKVTGINERTYCPGYFTLPNQARPYRCWRHGGHGSLNMIGAIEQSCDVYFYDLALNLGIDRFHQFISYFGFGKTTGIDLEGELPGLLPSREWKQQKYRTVWYPGETIIAGIGQGFTLTTPLQLAHATALIANQGKRLLPRVVRAIESRKTGAIETIPPKELDPIPNLSPTDWQLVQHAMEEVVHGSRGTAKAIGISSPYKMAGKTGTAQVFGLKKGERYDAAKIPKNLRDHALFIAFAPVKDPKIAVAVVAEHGGGGSKTAAPMARAILDKYLIQKEAGQPEWVEHEDPGEED